MYHLRLILMKLLLMSLLISLIFNVRAMAATNFSHYPYKYKLKNDAIRILSITNYQFDIPVTYNQHVHKWINYYTNTHVGREHFIKAASLAGKYAPIIHKIFKRQSLPRDLIFLAIAESGLNNLAISSAEAVGPWQFIKSTAKEYGLKIEWQLDERKDPIKSTVAAGYYLRKLFKEFGSWELTFAAYNAGEKKIWDAIKKYNTYDFWKIRKEDWLKDETKEHVAKIIALAIIGKNLKQFNLANEIVFSKTLDFEEVLLPAGSDLLYLTEKLGVNYKEIKRLNPELLQWFTPFSMKSYCLRVPVGDGDKWKSAIQNSNDWIAQKRFSSYTVKAPVVNLSKVALVVDVDANILSQVNQIPKGAILRRGDVILLPTRQQLR